MSQKGWISMYRKIVDNWIYPTNEKRKFTKFEAWMDILLMVNHEPKKIPFGTDVITVERGQRITSVKGLAERWKWSRTKTDNFLKTLEKEHQIEQKRTSKATFITVVNYGVYQGEDVKVRGKKTSESEKKDIRKTSERHQKSTNNNENNYNNDNKKDVREKKYTFSDVHLKLAELLFKKISENNPKAKKPDFESWANTFRLMMERDECEGKEIQDMILWTQQHSFWHTNILSANKLREQYDRLYLQLQEDDNLKLIKGGKRNEVNRPTYETDYSEYDFNRREEL